MDVNKLAYQIANILSQNSSSENKEKKKRSGAKSGQAKNGKPYVQGWKYVKGKGIMSILCQPYKGTKSYANKNGEAKESWIAKVQIVQNGIVTEEYVRPADINLGTKKVTIQSMGLVLNPKAKDGGYMGRYSRSKKYN